MATTAAIGGGGVVMQGVGDEEFAKEEHAACMGYDELVVATYPT